MVSIFDVILTKPYCRMTVYFMGVLSGIILYHYRTSGKLGDAKAVRYGRLFDIEVIRYSSFLIGLCLINFYLFV